MDAGRQDVHDVVFRRQAASHVSGQDSRDEKGDFKGRLKQTRLLVWLVEMEDAEILPNSYVRHNNLKRKRGTII